MNFDLKSFLNITLAMMATYATYTPAALLPTTDGLKTDMVVNSVESPIATVIYIAGLGGNGNDIQGLSNDFAAQRLNLVTFDRDEPPCKGFQCFGTVGSRVPSGQPIYAEGEPSALDHIVANEILAVFDFVTKQDWYQTAPKLYLIGGSYGAWITLQASVTPNLGNLINGAVLVSPSVAPHKSTGKYASEMLRFDVIKTGFKGKPVLAIGSQNDALFPGATTADSLDLLERELRDAKIEIVQEPTGKHAKDLLFASPDQRQLLIDWIAQQALTQ